MQKQKQELTKKIIVTYIPPAAVLNVSIHGHRKMPSTDEFHADPQEWLDANASRFQFTDDQLISAASPQFAGHRCSIERWSQYTHVCGIYFLVANKEIIYIGQSNLIPRRIFQHRDNFMEFDSLVWFEVPELFLSTIESYYIGRIRPRFNRDAPDESVFTRRLKLYRFQ